jgi:hypothetical protein
VPGPDFYDVSIINGINLAASFGPVAGTYQAVSGDPYSCTTPGSQVAQGSLEACNWTITPTVSGADQTTLLRNVSPVNANGQTCGTGAAPNSIGYCECSTDSDCSASGLVCGLAQNAGKDQYTQVCGNKIGWWTADQLCGSSTGAKAPLGAPLNCGTTFSNSDGSISTYTNLHICTQPAGATKPEQAQSCYNSAAVSDCCGCATSASADGSWPTTLNPGFGGSDNGCYSNNPNWVSIAQPWLVFLKNACPTAYTYAFDDATSTFTCQGSSTVGPPSYQVSFFDTK